MIELTLLRHGATQANLEHRYLGRTDLPLLPEEVDDLSACPKAGDMKADLLFSSPMYRCLQTLTALFPSSMQDGNDSGYQVHTRDPIQVIPEGNDSNHRVHVQESIHIIPEWTEMDFGAFEMMNYAELNGNPDYQAWIDGGGIGAFPGGENRDAFCRRCMLGYERFLGGCREARSGKEVSTYRAIAVVHGGTIMALLHSLSGEDYFRFQVKNREGYRLLLDDDGALQSFEKIRLFG